MVWITLKMLMGDKSKYFAIIFGVSFASFLIAEQSATFYGVMLRTTSQIRDTHGADIPENKLVREKKVLVGQLLDVFIDTRSPSSDDK